MNGQPKFLRIPDNSKSNRALFCRNKLDAAKLFYMFEGSRCQQMFAALWDFIELGKASNLLKNVTNKLKRADWRTIEDVTLSIIDFNKDSVYIFSSEIEVDLERKILERRHVKTRPHPPPLPPPQNADECTLFLPGFLLSERLI